MTRRLLKHAASILAVVALHIECVSLFVLVHKLLLEVPVVRPSAYRKLEIFLGDRVPVLGWLSARRHRHI